jgi:hypothetical protein
MQRTVDDVKNWMNMFRWIVKLIRDEYQVEEARLTRAASLDRDLGLSPEQIARVLATIAESFSIFFPLCASCEVERLEELCMLASWLSGLYKRPDFVCARFEAKCRDANPWLVV